MSEFKPAPAQLSFLSPPDNIRRRAPRQRKGESWYSYAIRHATWYAQAWPPERLKKLRQCAAAYQESRKKIVATNQRHCQRLVELAKQNRAPNGLGPMVPNPVAFWFGQVGQPHAGRCQYIGQAELDFLLERGRA